MPIKNGVIKSINYKTKHGGILIMLIETSDELTTLDTVEKLLKDNGIEFSGIILDIPEEKGGFHEMKYSLISIEDKEKLYKLIMELCKQRNILKKANERLGYSNESYLNQITELNKIIEKYRN